MKIKKKFLPVVIMIVSVLSLMVRACWWDNDVSINGDHQVPATLADTPEARAACYYAPGHHPRSFHARWVWLGLRNRASALAAMLGRKLTPAEVQDADTWGDETIGKTKEGWCVRRNGPLYQLYIIRSALCACVCTTATSSTTPASGAALQWWST
jgi:hypothetical protein